jgi:hypothetical protein
MPGAPHPEMENPQNKKPQFIGIFKKGGCYPEKIGPVTGTAPVLFFTYFLRKPIFFHIFLDYFYFAVPSCAIQYD